VRTRIIQPRISCNAALDKAAHAPFGEERRMKFAKATKFHRKSGRRGDLNFRAVQIMGLIESEALIRWTNWRCKPKLRNQGGYRKM
jgi:hypothetical protein